MKCPCCGGDVPQTSKVLVSLDCNTVTAGGKTVAVTGREAEVALLLASAMPAPVSNEWLISRVYGGLPADDAYNCIKTYVRRLHKKIVPLGLAVENTYGRGHAMKWQGQQ